MSNFGHLDSSYQAAGGEEGLRKLSDDFYHEMSTLPEAQVILKMHPENLDVARDKLTLFLCGWLGGPRRYAEKYGAMSLPMSHQKFIINEAERDAWLLCMERALQKQPYTEEFKEYLLRQLFVPAERIRMTSRSE